MYVQYNMNQTSLPLELSTCIDPNHIVFSIYNFVDSLDDHYFKIFETQDGRPAYHPKPLIMSLLYAYNPATITIFGTESLTALLRYTLRQIGAKNVRIL